MDRSFSYTLLLGFIALLVIAAVVSLGADITASLNDAADGFGPTTTEPTP